MERAKATPQTSQARTAQLALGAGILFCAAYTALLWWLSGRLQSVPHLPDQGASWYYWQLAEPTVWSRATAWGFYLAHQFTLWGLIWWAQTRVKRYTPGLHPINLIALGANALFALLHLLQTHLWYDGLAQDVSIWSSFGSVAILLIFVLLMENPRRGLFFGWKAPLGKEVTQAVRKYHGYYFAWAIVYTFWYHPAEGTPGHLVGFFYTLLLMLQGSLFFSRIHLNRWWTLAQEVMVLLHGALVAVSQGAGLWPMFAFGFGGIFVITQMHGLGWSRATKGVVLAAYAGLTALVYSQRGWGAVNEILRIPLIDYVAVFLFAGIIGGLLRLARKRPDRAPVEPVEAESLADEQSRYITAAGWRVHYKEAGQGAPALVLLHGFGASLFSWREVLARPEGLGRLYAFDRPAFGLTERKLPGDYSPEAQVELLVSLLDRWNIKKAVLVGNSAGGTVALHTALRHPDRVAALVLVDAAVYRGGGAPPFIKPLLATRWGERAGLFLLRRLGGKFIAGILRSYHDPAKVTEEVKQGYMKLLKVRDWDRALWAFTLASRQSDVAPRLPEIKQPCLVITGEHDRIVPAAESERLARELPDARLVTIPQCGHLPQEECPEAFLGALRTFVSSLSDPPMA